MSGRRFREAIKVAADKALAGHIPGVSSVKRGDSDGEIVITYSHEALPSSIHVQVIAQGKDHTACLLLLPFTC